MNMNAEGTKCRGCGADIFFIKTNHFKTVPVDAEPVWIRQETGGKAYFRKDGSTVIGYIAGDADDDPDTNLIEAYRSHFATCPRAEEFRRNGKKERKARTTARRTVF